MIMRLRTFAAALVLTASTLYAQQPFQRQTEATPTQPLAGDTQVLWNAYERAVFDSGIYQRWNVRPLRPIVADDKGNVLVATLTSKNGNVGETLTAGTFGLWGTGVPEVQTICRGLHPDVPRFLVLSVAAADLFRPSPDDNISSRYPCAMPSDGTMPNDCGNAFPST